MMESWTVGRRVAFGFTLVVLLTALVAIVGVRSLRDVTVAKDRVITVELERALQMKELAREMEYKVTQVRGYLLTGEAIYMRRLRESHDRLLEGVNRLSEAAEDAEERRAIHQVLAATRTHQAAVEQILETFASGARDAALSAFEEDVVPAMDALRAATVAYSDLQANRGADARRHANDRAEAAANLTIALSVLAVILASLVGFFLTRSLTTRLGEAVQHLQSSASELQAAATQQAGSSREQASATHEASSTMSELLATARQIAESAQHVSRIAGETQGSARQGGERVKLASTAIGGIKQQVDRIVHQMLDLGKKSQQIGAILELINELADQTNILAINATIEAAGAGENGRRFGAVADEIRGLADRVGGSAKEIRVLIEEIRAAANATVMTTEDGLKASEAGLRRFEEVASGFDEILRMVVTTAEAAREIELSTKQQTSAVEQVNAAVTNVTQAARENEVGARQTQETATQLLGLSGRLSRLVREERR